MKRISLVIVLFLLLTTIKSQNMDPDTIQLTPNLQLHQEQKSTDDLIEWSLILSDKEFGVIDLKKAKIAIKPTRLIGNNYYLNIPQLIAAYKEDQSLLVYLYEKLELNLYVYDFVGEKEFTTKKYAIAKLISGSVDNFGGYNIQIHGKKIKGHCFFDTKYGRSIGPDAEFMFKYNLQTGKISTYKFSNAPLTVRDEQKLFLSMNLDNNNNQIEKLIRETINIHKKNSNEIGRIKYLGYLDDFSSYYSNKNSNCRDDGIIYFFYEEGIGNIQIIRYNNYKNEWLIGDYEETNIEQSK